MNTFLKKYGQTLAVFATCASVLLIQFWNIRAWAYLPERVLKVEVINAETLAKFVEMDKQGTFNLSEHKVNEAKEFGAVDVRLTRLETVIGQISTMVSDIQWIKKTLENHKP